MARTKTLTHIEPLIPAVFAMILVIVGIYCTTVSTTDRQPETASE